MGSECVREENPVIRDAWTIALTIPCILFKVMVDDTWISGDYLDITICSLSDWFFLFLCRTRRPSLMS